MSGFSGLSYSQINEIASSLNSNAGSMKDILNAISTQLKKVGSDEGTWTGTAASAAFEEFNKLIQKFPEFEEAVRSCATHLNNVVATYQSVDSAIMGK